jgi:hypothetical protein
MRRALVVIAALMVLLALDAVFNDYRFSGRIYSAAVEFGRLVNRTIDSIF